MAKARKRTVMDKKARKRAWIQIVAPDVFNSAELGEIPLASQEEAIGRVVTANLMNITHDIKQQNINIHLRVTEIKDNQAVTSIQSFTVMPTAVKRMTHRRIDVIEDSSVYKTKDERLLRIKPMLLTRGNTSNSIQQALRKGMRNIILRAIRSASAEEAFRDALSNKIQYDIERELSKLYPVKSVVIREMGLERERTRKKSKAVEKEEEVTVKKAASKEEEWGLPKEAVAETQPELEEFGAF